MPPKCYECKGEIELKLPERPGQTVELICGCKDVPEPPATKPEPNIVERLRKTRAEVTYIPYHKLLTDAAKEIEQLRLAIDQRNNLIRSYRGF